MSQPQINQARVTRYRDENVTNLLQYANDKRVAGFFNDFTIQTRAVSIKANKMILSCYSKFFENIFLTKFRDKQYQDRVEIHQFDGNAVKSIIQYIYTGCIDIDGDNVMNLLATADFLQMDDVKRFCFEYFESILTIDNCIDIIQASSFYRNPSSMKETYKFISNNFDKIAQTEKFKELSNDHLVALLAKLDRKNVRESLIYTAIISWIREDRNRKQIFPSLFLSLDLLRLPVSFLDDVVTKEALVQNNRDCFNAVLSCALKKLRDPKLVPGDEKTSSNLFGAQASGPTWNADMQTTEPTSTFFKLSRSQHDKQKSQVTFKTRSHEVDDKPKHVAEKPKNRRVKIQSQADNTKSQGNKTGSRCDRVRFSKRVYGSKLLSVSSTVEEIYSKTGKPKQNYPNMPETPWRLHNYAFKLEDAIYCINRSELYRLDVKKTDLKWEQLESMLDYRSSYAAAIVRKTLVVSGGYMTKRNSDGRAESILTNSSELYDVQLNEWRRMSPTMKYCRYEHAMVEAGGSLFAMGGYGRKSWVAWFNPVYDDEGDPLSSVECLDSLEGSWKTVRSMFKCRVSFPAVSYGRCVYVVGGGAGGGRTVEKYDPASRQWNFVKDMNVDRRGNHAACVWDGKIFVVGGSRQANTNKTFEYYDLIADQWSKVWKMDNEVTNHSVVVV